MDTNTDKSSQPTAAPYSSYVLRLWHTQPNGAWRATLKDVRDGSQRSFTSFKPLVEFLAAQTEQTGEQS